MLWYPHPIFSICPYCFPVVKVGETKSERKQGCFHRCFGAHRQDTKPAACELACIIRPPLGAIVATDFTKS
jgi:hypothetical protein